MPATELHTYFADIQLRFAYEFGWDPDPDNWSTDQDTLFNESLFAGQRQFYFPPVVPGDRQPHKWNFLRRSLQIESRADSELTGLGNDATVNESGVVSGGFESSFSIPSLAGDGGTYIDFRTDGIPLIRIVKTLTLSSAQTDFIGQSLTISSQHIVFTQLYIPLPDDFSGTEAVGFSYSRSEGVQGSIPIVPDEEVQRLDHFGRESDYPQAASIVAMPVIEREGGSFTGTRYFARFYPRLQPGKIVNLNYYSNPHSVSEGSKNIPDGAAVHSEAILASVIDKGHELILHENTHHARFLELLKAAVELDRRYNALSSSGQGDQSDGGYDTSAQLHEAVKYRRQLMPYSNMTLNFGG